MTTNYKDMEAKISALVPFTGNSAKAFLITDKDSGQVQYKIYSYSALIAEYDNGAVWITDKRYSVTTSKLTNMIKKVWATK